MRNDLIKNIITFKERGMKPNYSKLAKEYDADRRTIKKYYEKPSEQRKKRIYTTKYDKYEHIIADKIKVPGITLVGIYAFLRNEHKVDASYNCFTHFCRTHGYSLAGGNIMPHVRFTTQPGHQVQVDWKEDLTLYKKNGDAIVFNVFTATLGYSRKHIFIYSRTKTEQDFIRCVNEMLRRYGGAVDEILTDNMSAIVSVSNERKQRRKHANILQWEKDSDIRIRLCKPRSPETKGKDESANRFLNRLRPYTGEIESEDDIIRAIQAIQNDSNDKVNDEIGMSPESLFNAKEKQALRPMPNMSLLDSYIDGGMTQEVPNTMLVPFHGSSYSVPAEYIGLRVRILRNVDTIDIYYNGKLIATHEYVDGKKINYDKKHYEEGLRLSIGKSEVDLVELAENNLKGFDNIT